MNRSVPEVTTTPITRRKSIQLLLGFSIVSTVGGIILPIISYLLPRSGGVGYGGPTEVGMVGDFPVGTGKVVPVNDKPVIIVNTKTGGLKAFSAICTHLGCIVYWDQKKSVIHSPCHDGLFNPTTGAVVSGPPPRALPAYELAVQNGKVLVGKPLGQIYGT
jgi:Rieske Fe-S protein